ncbi:MAG TPA: glutathione S-transferase family protein [Steroidobacteraceae bacterium]|nr:glutathione S-transferase family protein [Steroidobacteraceae bacterium]
MSLPTLVIGTKNLSSWSLRAWLTFKHLAIAFDEIELPLDTPEYYRRIDAFSPTRRVPVLIDGVQKIWDSLAICEYANDISGGKGWPQNSLERAHARSISAEMHSGFQALRNCWPMNAAAMNLNVTLTEDAANDVARIDDIWRDCRGKYGSRGRWLFGEFTIADAMYAPVVLRFRSYGAKLSSAAQQYMTAALADPHLRAWINDSRVV